MVGEGQSVPVPRPAKARLLQDGKDMFWSMAPLVVACVALAGMLGMCSFAPQGPGKGPAPQYDAPAALKADAAALHIPIRVPVLPEGWHANSGGRGSIDAGRIDPATKQPARALTSKVGYLTAGGMYVALTQSNADEEKLVASIHSGMYPTGAQDIGGVHWIVYDGAGDDQQGTEPIWTAKLNGPTGPAQIAVSGSAAAGDYRTLAEATQKATPIS
ncbi:MULTISPECIES: DUF4245 domain-containing protein [unclassified Mycolicibacterium]|uniref:DUF4245 domain-containing protein n=1 Tax=unclassified Mycolicibacterium TaxID=2636767 RepID=UPI002814E313|nr:MULTISPECIES: DUF4245 domain-containing protein [unclassified Mycolicibacterium]